MDEQHKGDLLLSKAIDHLMENMFRVSKTADEKGYTETVNVFVQMARAYQIIYLHGMKRSIARMFGVSAAGRLADRITEQE